MPQPTSSSFLGRQAWALVSFLAVSCICGVLIAGVAIPGAGIAAHGTKAGMKVFDALPASLHTRPLAQQSTMLASDGSVIAKFYWENRIEKPLKDISPHVQDATVATEDNRFFKHGGVDLSGIGRAAVHNIVSPSTQGASTLTQQYVKNVLVESAHSKGDSEDVAAAVESQGSSGIARKVREAKLAVAVEKKFSKKEILNRYLNINNYSGSPNQYGVEAAARHYWGVSASDLTIAQSALLAGIVQNPAHYNPERHPKDATARRNSVLDKMQHYGYINQKQHDKAAESGLDLDIHNTPRGCVTAGISAYFCDYVERTIETNPVFGKNVHERKTMLDRGGLTIKTTLDPSMQKKAKRAVTERVPSKDPSGVGHTLVTVEPGTGRIMAMAQNRKFSQSDKPSRGSSALNYNVDRRLGGGGGFQVGSAWKAFVLADWLKEDHKLYDRVDASRSNYSGFKSSCDSHRYAVNGYGPKNAGDSEGKDGPMTVLEGTKLSVNTAFAAMASQLDMCGIRDIASSLGVHTGTGKELKDDTLPGGVQRVLYPSSILGSENISPLTMAAAYAAFPADGKYCKPIGIDSISDRNGDKIKVPSAGCHQAIDKNIATTVGWALTKTFDGGTTEDLKIGVPAGAKTGTTNFEVGSTWLMGYTKGLSTAVWAGNPTKNQDMSHTTIGGQYYGAVYGATIAGKTWQSYMSQVAPNHPHGDFASPDKSMVGTPPAPPEPPKNSSDDESPSQDSGESKPDDSASKSDKSDDSGKDSDKSDKPDDSGKDSDNSGHGKKPGGGDSGDGD